MKVHTHPLFDDAAQQWGPPVTDALVQSVENRLGLKLPVELVDTLRTCNGGRLRRNRLTVEGRARPLFIRDFAGIGYPEGLEASAALAEEWDYPQPALVLSAEGPTALLLDYRQNSDPTVIFVDTDTEVDGLPAAWSVAPSFAELCARLSFSSSRSHIAVLGVPHADELLEAATALGAVPPTRPDHEGAYTRSIDGWRCAESGPALLRLLPARRPDGSRRLPELAAPDTPLWVAETNVADIARFIATFEAIMPGDHLRLTL